MLHRRLHRGASVALTLLLAACGHRAPELAPTPVPVAAPAPATHAGEWSAADIALLKSRSLMVPVSGIAATRIADTFHEARDGARVHRAVDILAPRGTAVLSADTGTVLRISANRLGGLTVYAVDPDRRLVYYYAHLDHYADSLRAGMSLAKGQVIGYVGTTGNAPPDTPHLHFQVMRMDDPKRYWDGTPLDPRPWFVATGRTTPAAVAAVPLSVALPARKGRGTTASAPHSATKAVASSTSKVAPSSAAGRAAAP